MLTLLYLLGGGVLLITWISLLSLYITKKHLENSEKELNIKFKKLAYERESAIDAQSFLNIISAKLGRQKNKGLPPEILDLISNSPNHSEIQEIDEADDLIGIIFNNSYPPDFSEE